MPHDPRKLLEDMRQAARYVQAFTAGSSAEEFPANMLLRSAVERQFEIVGEALSRLLKLAPDVGQRISAYRRIVNFRNLLSHGYDAVEPSVVWDIIEQDLPVLINEVESLLAELGAG